MCVRASYDPHWCATHHDDFVEGSLSCESIVRDDRPPRSRRRDEFPVTLADLRSDVIGECPYCGEVHRWLVA